MSKNSSIKNRILAYLEHRGVSVTDFYKDSKISRSVLNHGTGLSEDNLTKFLEYDLDTNFSQRVRLDWLIRGEGDMMEPYIYNQEKAFLDTQAGYGEKDKKEAMDELIARLNKMNNQYSISLKEITINIKQLQDEDWKKSSNLATPKPIPSTQNTNF